MTVASSALRVCPVGCGLWGSLILRDLKQLGCVVVAVTQSAESQQRALAGGAEVMSSLDAVGTVAGFVVATPTISHAAVIESVLDRGVPIFVEKPLANDATDAARIAKAGAGRVFVMDKWRYHPGIRELGRLARSGELGPVIGVRSFRLGWGNPHDDVDTTWILAPHDLSIALEILGHVPRARAAVAEWAGDEVVGMIGFCGDSPWHVLEV